MPKADRPANRPDAGVTGNVMAKALTANLIVGGPDQVRVRLDRQRLERSVDGGLSWTLERQDVQDALSAGACPSDQVCWLAGSNATWVRDASGAWTRQAMPAGARATAVSAADALHAVVTRADGSRLETADGGVTWTAVLVP